ncbi:hypothetical protein BDF21DRAFT_428608 [Thamnidium elegans]|nr:hypothetical protein BDF21DRAFT_428608 [Thamnidium elegans]
MLIPKYKSKVLFLNLLVQNRSIIGPCFYRMLLLTLFLLCTSSPELCLISNTFL